MRFRVNILATNPDFLEIFAECDETDLVETMKQAHAYAEAQTIADEGWTCYATAVVLS